MKVGQVYQGEMSRTLVAGYIFQVTALTKAYATITGIWGQSKVAREWMQTNIHNGNFKLIDSKDLPEVKYTAKDKGQ